MNRSLLKSASLLLLGFVLGRGSGHPSAGSGGARVAETRPPTGTAAAAGTVSVPEAARGAGFTDLENESGIAEFRRERVAAQILGLSRQRGETARMSLLAKIGELSAGDADRVAGILAPERMDPETAILVAAHWAALNPKAALTFAMEQQSLREDKDLMVSLLLGLEKVDRAAAAEAISALCGEIMTDLGRPVYKTRRPVYDTLTLKETRTALACARAMEIDWAERMVLEHMAEKEPLEAAAELVPGKRTHDAAVRAIAFSLLDGDRAAFDSWAGGLSDPVQRTVARCAALSADAVTDPEKAARETAAWLAREPGAAEHARELSGLVVKKWLEQEGPPAAVAAWAAGLPQGSAREAAIQSTGGGWMKQDIMGASAWLASLPQSHGRDWAVRDLVDHIRQETPADAFEWARSLGDPALRYDTLKSTLVLWAEKDPAAARAAVEALPAGDQGYLMESLPPPGGGGGGSGGSGRE